MASYFDENRVTGKNVSLNRSDLEDFFKKRSRKKDSANPYVSVIYQDDNPELALKRDRHEKHLIIPKLQLDTTTKLLDIGCGIGRWADVLESKVDHYVGIDFSDDLISQARKRFEDSSSKIDFKVCAAESANADSVGYRKYFDRLIISGVLIYLNDQDIVKCFRNISSLLVKDSVIYIREPLSVTGERLTLVGVWSDNMSQKYSAIYRTKEELEALASQGLERSISLDFKPLYEYNSLNNRKETMQFYTVIGLNL